MSQYSLLFEVIEFIKETWGKFYFAVSKWFGRRVREKALDGPLMEHDTKMTSANAHLLFQWLLSCYIITCFWVCGKHGSFLAY